VPGPPPRPRLATAADAAGIARILTEALGDKLRPAFGGHAAAVMTALVAHDLGRRAVRYWVVERDGAVVGAVHLALAQEPDPGFAARVADIAGWRRALWATLVLTVLAHGRLAPDEAYVEELGVAREARRGGVGRALMLACEDEARRRGKSRLTLWVTANNAAGIALYRSLGFTVARRRVWLWGRVLFRAPAALFMEKRLDGRPTPAYGAVG
jgi:ribosomal protein S18 acetylase RimI-like enzyme